MPNGQPDTPLLKSYVWHNGKCFYVTTYERDSSSSNNPGRYVETLGWTHNTTRNCNETIIAHTGDGEAFRQHSAVCEQLFRTGEWNDPRDDWESMRRNRVARSGEWHACMLIEAAMNLIKAAKGPVGGPTSWNDTRDRWIEQAESFLTESTPE